MQYISPCLPPPPRVPRPTSAGPPLVGWLERSGGTPSGAAAGSEMGGLPPSDCWYMLPAQAAYSTPVLSRPARMAASHCIPSPAPGKLTRHESSPAGLASRLQVRKHAQVGGCWGSCSPRPRPRPGPRVTVCPGAAERHSSCPSAAAHLPGTQSPCSGVGSSTCGLSGRPPS